MLTTANVNAPSAAAPGPERRRPIHQTRATVARTIGRVSNRAVSSSAPPTATAAAYSQ